jgi:hypothetical protein
MAPDKDRIARMIIIMGCDLWAWFKPSQYISQLNNLIARRSLIWPLIGDHHMKYYMVRHQTSHRTPCLSFGNS